MNLEEDVMGLLREVGWGDEGWMDVIMVYCVYARNFQ